MIPGSQNVSAVKHDERLMVLPLGGFGAMRVIPNAKRDVAYSASCSITSPPRSWIILCLRRLLCYPRGVFPFFFLFLLSRVAYASIGFAHRSGEARWDPRMSSKWFRLMWFVQLT